MRLAAGPVALGNLLSEIEEELKVGQVALEQEIPGVDLWNHGIGGNSVEVVPSIGVLELKR